MTPESPSQEPLPATPFEHYMFAADTPAYPMHFYVRLILNGRIDQSSLAKALSAAIQRHPLLTATLTGSPHAITTALRWMWQSNRTDVAYFHDHESRLRERMDLIRAPGIRAVTLTDGATTTLWLQCHHAATDGIGALHFAIDLCRQLDAPDEPMQQGLSQGLASRGQPDDPLPRWQRWAKDLARINMYLTTFPEQLSTRPEQPQIQDCLPFTHTLLNSQTLTRLATYAHINNATINDVFVTTIFRTIQRWKAKQSEKPRRVPLRIAIPISMREARTALTACNRMSFCFLDRSLTDQCEASQLLRSIAREMANIKKDNMGQTLLRVQHWLGKLPFGMQQLTRRYWHPRNYATAILSNLGRIENFMPAVPVVLRRIDLFPPIMQDIHLAVGIVTLRDEVSASFHYDQRHLQLDDVRGLMELFSDELNQMMQANDCKAVSRTTNMRLVGS